MAEEERAKSSEEKFQKLKNMYTQIRDEHIKLLRQVSIIILYFLLKKYSNLILKKYQQGQKESKVYFIPFSRFLR